MKWRFSDGTIYEGGKVQGDSALAREIRLDLSRVKAGIGVLVQVDVCPSERERLELDDPQLVHAWLWALGVRHDVRVVSAPELPPIEPAWPAEDDDDPPGTVY